MSFWEPSVLPSPERIEELRCQRREKAARASAKAAPVDPLDPMGWAAAFRQAMPDWFRLAEERDKAAEERRRVRSAPGGSGRWR